MQYFRPVKFPGAAHFYLRCGCSNTTKKPEVSSSSASNRIHSVDEYQLPVVALSFNFSPPPSFSNKIQLLSLDEIETLHHEWGHALHSLLSRTTFQHLSGTRGATDFVEVEYLPCCWCCWCCCFLSCCCYYYCLLLTVPYCSPHVLVRFLLICLRTLHALHL
jgi:Zn-dependent oligopeptidase